MRKANNWIFVTGTPRSGSTFVGKVLSSRFDVDYIHEPFNPDCGLYSVDSEYIFASAEYPATDKLAEDIETIFNYSLKLRTGFYKNDTTLKRVIKKFIGGRGPFYLQIAKLNPFNMATVIKDPIGCLMTDYLVSKFEVRPIIIIRHPLAFVASAKRLGWSLNLDSLLRQDCLMKKYFSAAEIALMSDRNMTKIEYSAHLWRALNKVLSLQCSENPDWMCITHEALSENPVTIFKQMFEYSGITWSDRIAQKIHSMTSSGNKVESSLKRVQDFNRSSKEIFNLRKSMLSEAERKTIWNITKDVALLFYDKNSFDLKES